MKTELSHESLKQLMPWYANGTLSPEENANVELHLQGCAACKSELQWLREVGAAMNDLADEAPSVQPSFAKALAAVEQWESSKAHTNSSWISKWFCAIWNPSIPVARWATASQFAVIAGLCLVLWFSHREVKPGYTTLSGSELSTSGGAKLTVSFTPNTTVDDVRRILIDIGGNIVSGPSANGICIVQLPVAADNDLQVQATIQKLRDNKSIRFVERLP
jgi:hypothetical protein